MVHCIGPCVKLKVIMQMQFMLVEVLSVHHFRICFIHANMVWLCVAGVHMSVSLGASVWCITAFKCLLLLLCTSLLR